MSGGSFNYLCFKSPGEAIESGSLADMFTVLYREFPNSYAASHTARLLAVRDELRRRVEELHDVWRAIEWWKSCDWSREDAERAVAAYDKRLNDAIAEIERQNSVVA